MLIQPEKVALVKVRLRKAVRRCEKLWIRFVSASAKGLKNAEKWALRILKRAEDWLEKLLAQAVKEKIKAAFTQECHSRKAVNLVMPVACVLVLASVLSLVPLAPRAAAADHEPAAETANLTITPRYAVAEIAEAEALDMHGELVEACGIYVDNKLYSVIDCQAQLQFFLDALLNQEKLEDPDAEASYAQEIEVVSGLYPSGSVKSYDEIKEILLSVLQIQVTKTETYQEEIPFDTVTVSNDVEYTVFSNVVNEGADGVQECVDQVTYLNGKEVSRSAVKRIVVQEPVSKTIETGTRTLPDSYPEGYQSGQGSGVATGSFLWPLPYTYHITSPFEMRWGTMHKGIDIAEGGVHGATVRASDGGVVTIAGDLNDGYGNYVVIDHGNGYKTLYAHGSAIYVTQGQYVSKGQPILAVGNSGNSYGSHLHFEIIENGTEVNPLNFDFE